jgi:hypothetical protein
MKIKNCFTWFFISLLLTSSLLAEDKFYFDLTLTYTQKSDFDYALMEKFTFKNNRLTYEWKYTGQHPDVSLPREIKRTGILKKSKKLEEFLDASRLFSDMNILLYSKRLPQDDYQAEIKFKIYHQERLNDIFIHGLRPLNDEKNREYDIILEFVEMLKKELSLHE